MFKTPSDQQQDIQHSASIRVQIGIAFLVFLLIGANDGAFGVLIPSISTHYQRNKATISLIFLVNTAGCLTAAVNNGFLIARLGERIFLLSGLALLVIFYGR